jgi:RHS repeat-associated protein
MTGATDGTLSNSYTYNGIGQRTGKTDSHGTFNYVLADDAIDSPVLSDGQATYEYALGLVSEVRSSGSKFFHTDSLGTTRTLTDATQTVTDNLETDAFGNVVAVAGGGILGARPFGFAGQHGYQTDTDTGLMRLGHRYYDASTGRFISRDPIQDGYNWYTYCNNDPVNVTDPEGLKPPDPRPWMNRYKSVDEAAKAVLVYIYPKSNKEQMEYGGLIIDIGDKLDPNDEYKYVVTVPRTDEINRTVQQPSWGNRKVVGEYHTHPDLQIENVVPDIPSRADKQRSDGNGAPAYIGTPGRGVIVYEPDPNKEGLGKIREISIKLKNITSKAFEDPIFPNPPSRRSL